MKKIVSLFLTTLFIGTIFVLGSKGIEAVGNKNNCNFTKEVIESEDSNNSKETNTNSKTLVVYFSHSGKTEKVANYIKDETGADIFEIETVKDYPENYDECADVAAKEKEENARPELKNLIDVSPYDTIFIGYPIWWGTIPMPVFTFLESNNFKDKTVIPFCTHSGSGLGNSVDDVKNRCMDSYVEKGLAIRGDDAGSDDSKKAVKCWIRELGIK